MFNKNNKNNNKRNKRYYYIILWLNQQKMQVNLEINGKKLILMKIIQIMQHKQEYQDRLIEIKLLNIIKKQ